MAKLGEVITKEEREFLDLAIENAEAEEAYKEPVKLSDQLREAYEDDEIALTVNRKIKGGRKTSFLFEIDQYDDLPALQTKLRDEYGGGDFSIVGRKQDGSFALKQSLTIEAPQKAKEDTTSTAGGSFESILLAMQEQNAASSRETRDMMMQMQQQNMATQLEAAKNQSDMLVRMMEMNKPQENTSMSDMLNMMMQMRALEPEKADPMETLIKGMEMGKELGGGGGGGDDSILQTALKTFGKPLADMAQATAAQQIVAPSLPTPQATFQQQQSAQEPAKENNNMNLDLLKFKPYLEKILTSANNGELPQDSATMIVNELPHDLIKTYVLDDAQFGRLYNIMPDLERLRPWLDKFRAATLHLLEPPLNNQHQAEKSVTGLEIPTRSTLVHGQPNASSAETIPGTRWDEVSGD